jgi:cell division protein FtsB
MSTWGMIYRFSWGLLAVLIVIGLLCVFTPKCRTLSRLQTTRTDLEQKNTDTTAEIKDLKIKQERFTSEPAFVERTARESGMVAPGEVIYKFTDPNGKIPEKR